MALTAKSVSESRAAAIKTNWVQHLNYTLTAWQVVGAKPFRITTKDLIQDLNGTMLSGSTSGLNFSKSAQLLVRQNLTNAIPGNQIIVRDSKTRLDTDVSELFSRTNGPVALFGGAKHSIQGFDLERAAGLSFALSGFTTETETRVLANGNLVNKTTSATVAGMGFTNTADLVIQGTISLSGGRLE
jgi:hypothetical protein